MRTLVLTLEDDLVSRAEAAAQRRHTSLEAAIRESLRSLAAEPREDDSLPSQVAKYRAMSPEERGNAYDLMMASLSHVRSKGPYTRDEMNER